MCGLGEVAAIVLNLVSALTYLKEESKRGKNSEQVAADCEVVTRKPTSTRLWRLLYDSAVALMLFPPILLGVIQTTRSLWPSSLAALYPKVAPWLPTVLVVTIFLSAPLSHLSGVVKGKGYELWQPLKGGVHYVTAQALGWMIYTLALLLAITSARNNWALADVPVVPLAVVSQGLISISILDWRGDDNKDKAEQHEENENLRKGLKTVPDSQRGFSIYTVGLCALCALASAHWYFDLFLSSWWNLQGALGWAIFFAAILSTLAGVHLMW